MQIHVSILQVSGDAVRDLAATLEEQLRVHAGEYGREQLREQLREQQQPCMHARAQAHARGELI